MSMIPKSNELEHISAEEFCSNMDTILNKVSDTNTAIAIDYKEQSYVLCPAYWFFGSNETVSTDSKGYPIQRDMDGVYARVMRDNKAVNRCFTDLTAEEQERFMQNLDKNGMVNLCKHLTEVLRNVIDQFDICCKDMGG